VGMASKLRAMRRSLGRRPRKGKDGCEPEVRRLTCVEIDRQRVTRSTEIAPPSELTNNSRIIVRTHLPTGRFLALAADCRSTSRDRKMVDDQTRSSGSTYARAVGCAGSPPARSQSGTLSLKWLKFPWRELQPLATTSKHEVSGHEHPECIIADERNLNEHADERERRKKQRRREYRIQRTSPQPHPNRVAARPNSCACTMNARQRWSRERGNDNRAVRRPPAMRAPDDFTGPANTGDSGVFTAMAMSLLVGHSEGGPETARQHSGPRAWCAEAKRDRLPLWPADKTIARLVRVPARYINARGSGEDRIWELSQCGRKFILVQGRVGRRSILALRPERQSAFASRQCWSRASKPRTALVHKRRTKGGEAAERERVIASSTVAVYSGCWLAKTKRPKLFAISVGGWCGKVAP
jgi:hypothetical protein